MSHPEPPAPFDGKLVDGVAAEFDVDGGRLTELIAAHQELMDRLPGVENLVYEWRKQFDATVLVQSEAWYFVAAPSWTWEEFGDNLEATEAEFAALVAAHARTVKAHPDVPEQGLEDASLLVLLRN